MPNKGCSIHRSVQECIDIAGLVKAGKKFKCPTCEEVIHIETNTPPINAITSTPLQSLTYLKNMVSEEDRRHDMLEEKRANDALKYKKLMSRSKTWTGWGLVFFCVAAISIFMIFQGDSSQVIGLAMWAGLGFWFMKKATRLREEADSIHARDVPPALDTTQPQTTDRVQSDLGGNGILQVTFPGQWFLVDAKTKIFVNGAYHSTHSTKEGFSIEVPLTKNPLELKLVIGMKNTKYELANLDPNRNYILTLEYSDSSGKYSSKFKLIESL